MGSRIKGVSLDSDLGSCLQDVGGDAMDLIARLVVRIQRQSAFARVPANPQ
jgi:hypothetical protein